MSRLTVNVFPAGFIWPLWAGRAKGFFAAQGVELELIFTPNSIQQMVGLIDGAFDIAMTAIDNVIAYMEGQGEVETKAVPDIVSVMGSSSGFLSLMAAPHIKTMADFKGKTLAVDAMTTGYSFTLRRMLEVSGLKRNEYTLVAVGGMRERYEALLRGEQAGTLSVPPFTVMAKAKGYNEVATPLSLFSHFQGGVAAVRREWAAAHGDEIVGFIRGNIASLAWLYDPANKQEALDLFQANMPGASRDAAEQSYAVLLHPVTGFPRDARIDMEGVRTVMEIRSEFGAPRRTFTDAELYYDPTYYDRAIAGV
ncbi:ABC transporter substrate-binding protein [Aquabacter sp. CN5-332]|uniref:ABC transporter substrate-binding protein n=1 Tax=Aquabacter sp. CN5-332 TaxID=3156608 RepID=UPI0032B3EA41